MRAVRVSLVLVAGLAALAACSESAEKKLACFDAADFRGHQQKSASDGMSMALSCTSKAPWYCDVAATAKTRGNAEPARRTIATMMVQLERCLVAKGFSKKRSADGMIFFDAPLGHPQIKTCGLDDKFRGAGDAGFRYVCA